MSNDFMPEAHESTPDEPAGLMFQGAQPGVQPAEPIKGCAKYEKRTTPCRRPCEALGCLVIKNEDGSFELGNFCLGSEV